MSSSVLVCSAFAALSRAHACPGGVRSLPDQKRQRRSESLRWRASRQAWRSTPTRNSNPASFLTNRVAPGTGDGGGVLADGDGGVAGRGKDAVTCLGRPDPR